MRFFTLHENPIDTGSGSFAQRLRPALGELAAAACLFALGPALAQAPGSWTQGTDMPGPSGTPASCALDGIFYVMGGHPDKFATNALTTVWAYNPATDSWSNRAPLPRGRHFLGQCAVPVDGIIYVVGGTGSGMPGPFIREVAAYNPQTDTWTNGTNPIPTGRGNLAACAVDGIIYAIGGALSTSAQSAAVEAYDPKTDHWTVKRSMPQARWFPAASVVNGIIYVFQGIDVFAYNPKTDTWTTKPSHFSPYSWGLMSAAVDGTIYLFGGFTQDWRDGNDFTLAYDPVNDQFTPRTRMPRTRAAGACGVIAGRVYLSGGASKEPLVNPGAIFYTSLDVFDPRGGASITLRYVDANSPGPTPPYTNWATAARVIQDAVDAAQPGDEIIVTNGIYATGGRAVGTNVSVNRVAVDKPLRLRSANGPQVTVIQGYQVPGTTNGDGAIRCVYLTNGATLSGFTLTNGATQAVQQDGTEAESSGGGVCCESTNALVSNCVLAGNSASSYGGGAYRGTLVGCTFEANRSDTGGGAFWSTLNNSLLRTNSAGGFGGGAAAGVLNGCVLVGNSALYRGGGALGSTLKNCILSGNSATWGGGLASDWFAPCAAYNCLLTGNSAAEGGGAHFVELRNCIAYFNTATNGSNYSYEEGGSVGDQDIKYSCTTPMPTTGTGNITNLPSFVDYAGGDLRLQSNSPCINAGHNAYAPGPTDLDGNPRIVSGTVDIGAYEFQGSGSTISYAWLQRYSLPTDGSVDTLDLDRDGHNTWQEWRCQTDPTNALSALRMLSAQRADNNIVLTWQSVPGVTYFLERSTNFGCSPPFAPLTESLVGEPGTTSYTDTNAANLSPFFYRVGVP